jgi:hypothetical protein
VIRWALAAVLVAGLAGCKAASAGTGQAAGPASSASAGLSDEASPAASASASAAPVLPDGRSPVYLTAIDTTKRTLTFDLIEFLTGDAAKKAWQKANPGSGQDGPDNDYFIVNDNPKLRTLPVADPVQLLVLDLSAGGVATKPIAFADAPAYFASVKPDPSVHRLTWTPFWITVKNGQITKMEEQFLP